MSYRMFPIHVFNVMARLIRGSSFLAFVGALFASTFLAGCATLFSGTSDDIRFESDPSGAEVVIDGIERGETPTTVTVSRDAFNDKRVTLQKEGYQDEVFRLRKDFATVAILNLGNFLFWGIDALSGAMFKYQPTQYSQELDRASTGSLMKDSDPRGAETDYEAFAIEELRDDSTGEVVLPDHSGRVVVHDSDQGVAYVFE